MSLFYQDSYITNARECMALNLKLHDAEVRCKDAKKVVDNLIFIRWSSLDEFLLAENRALTAYIKAAEICVKIVEERIRFEARLSSATDANSAEANEISDTTSGEEMSPAAKRARLQVSDNDPFAVIASVEHLQQHQEQSRAQRRQTLTYADLKPVSVPIQNKSIRMGTFNDCIKQPVNIAGLYGLNQSTITAIVGRVYEQSGLEDAADYAFVLRQQPINCKSTSITRELVVFLQKAGMKVDCAHHGKGPCQKHEHKKD